MKVFCELSEDSRMDGAIMDTSDEAILEMLKQRMIGNSLFLQYMEIVIERLRSSEEFERTPMLMAHTGRRDG